MPTEALALRTQNLRPSPTLAITAKAKRLRSEGHDVVNLAAGEPDFNTPEPICEAAAKAIRDGQTKYTQSAGTPELRAAVAEKFARDNGFRVPAEGVVVTCGAKHAVYGALMALVDPGDEVVLLAPYWMTYLDQVKLAGGVPVVVASQRENGYIPEIDAVKEALTPRTRAVIVNFPSNPSGAAVDRAWLKQLAALALRYGFWIISDEIYEKLVYDGHEHSSPAALSQEVADRTITINGCSKTYSMTGWRIGFMAAPTGVAKAVSNIQDQVTSNPNSIAQVAALAALALPPGTVEEMRSEFEARRDLMVSMVGETDGLVCNRPVGAFYVLADAAGLLSTGKLDDCWLADFLLDQALVATVPGSVFEAPDTLRLSFACGQDQIRAAMARVREALCTLPQ